MAKKYFGTDGIRGRVNETKINGTATNFNIFTNIVPNGEIQSEMNSPIPANTDTIPRIKPRIKPRIIFV